MFVVISKGGTKLNADVNVNDSLIKELIDKRFIWNPSNCECESDKSCDVGVYLGYENCKCRKKLVDKLVEECTENVEEVKLAIVTSAEHENVCKMFQHNLFCTVFNIFYYQHWNWYLLCLLQLHNSW